MLLLLTKSCTALLCGLSLSRLLSPWDFPGNNTGLGCHFLLQGIFLTRDWIYISFIGRRILFFFKHWATREALIYKLHMLYLHSMLFRYHLIPSCFTDLLLLLLLLSHFSCVRLCATPWTAAYQAPLSMGFAREEYWSGLPLPSPFIDLIQF